MSNQTNATSMVALRTDDGVWYELPTTVVDAGRIHDAETLDEVRGLLAAGGAGTAVAEGEPLVVRLSAELLAPFRVGDERAAALAAALTAGNDTAGFSTPGLHWQPSMHPMVIYGWVERAPGSAGPVIYRVPLNLVHQSAPSVQPLGYGR
jgi:hypothetical protein